MGVDPLQPPATPRDGASTPAEHGEPERTGVGGDVDHPSAYQPHHLGHGVALVEAVAFRKRVRLP
jgi:hypothetical protein